MNKYCDVAYVLHLINLNNREFVSELLVKFRKKVFLRHPIIIKFDCDTEKINGERQINV